MPFSVATLCFMLTRGTSRCTTSFAVKKVKRYSAVPTTTNPRVIAVKRNCRSASGRRSGATKMPSPAPTTAAPIVRAVPSFARSEGFCVIAPASEP